MAAKTPAKGGGESAKKTKLIIAIVALIAGGILIAWNFGAFESVTSKVAGGKSSNPNAKLEPELKKAYEKQQKQLEKLKEEGKAPEVAGS